jgi:hypothetical protein
MKGQWCFGVAVAHVRSSIYGITRLTTPFRKGSFDVRYALACRWLISDLRRFGRQQAYQL